MNTKYTILLTKKQNILNKIVLSTLINKLHNNYQDVFNQDFLNKYIEVINQLKYILTTKLTNICNTITQSIQIRICLKSLFHHIKYNQVLAQRYAVQLDQCAWLIHKGARNNLIYLICSSLNEADIANLRNKLNIKSCKGRPKALPLEISLNVINTWKQIT